MKIQRIITEIRRLYEEENEKPNLLMNSEYAFLKYPHLRDLYKQAKRYEVKWNQLVREVLVLDSKSIQYMNQRTMQLIRKFSPELNSYFEVKTEHGTYILPDRLSDFNRLLELYEEFFYEIFPGLTKRLNLEIVFEEYNSHIIKGNINWTRTLSTTTNVGLLKNPIEFTQIRPTKRFDVPENIILILSILQMKYDSMFLYEYNFTDPLCATEREKLINIINGCNQALKMMTLQNLITDTKKYVLLKQNDPRVLKLEANVYHRIQENSPENNLLKSLLKWRRMYRELNIRLISPNKTNFPIDHIKNIDTMYELWILFELLDFFSKEGGSIKVKKFPKEFNVQIKGKQFTLFYEKEHEGWSTVKATPDFSIEVDNELKIVMDAKNWLLGDRKDAIYKMLGYMNNLDTTKGVLFFPTARQLKKGRIHQGKGPNYKDVCLFNCVLHPSNLHEEYDKKNEELTQFLKLIEQI